MVVVWAAMFVTDCAVASRHNRTDTHKIKLHPIQVQTRQLPALRRGSRYKDPPQPRIYLQWIPLGKGKISALQWSVTGYVNHTPQQIPGVACQHKMVSVICRIVALVFCLTVLPVCVFVGGLYFEEGHKLCG